MREEIGTTVPFTLTVQTPYQEEAAGRVIAEDVKPRVGTVSSRCGKAELILQYCCMLQKFQEEALRKQLYFTRDLMAHS